MRNILLALSIGTIVLVGTALGEPDHPSSSWFKFRQFVRKYNKTYSSRREELRRFGIFKKNLKVIDARNRDGTIGSHDVNMFADLEQQEFLDKFTGYKRNSTKPRQADSDYKTLIGDPQPINWVDLGACTPVKNQGQCGSCWAFSAVEQIESNYFLETGKLIELSPQQVTSCDGTCYGCEGGWTENAYDYIKQAGGIETEASYPYVSGVTTETGTCQAETNKFVVKVSGYNTISYYEKNPRKGDEAKMASAIADGPLSICVDATAMQTYVGGILGASCGDSINHCIQAVGAGTENGTPYWIIRNSWGTSWGEEGYARVEYGINACGISSDATTANVS